LVKETHSLSEILDFLTYFNQTDYSIMAQFEDKLNKIMRLPSVSPKMMVKFSIVRYLRHLALFSEIYEVKWEVLDFLFSEDYRSLLTFEDYMQLHMVLSVLEAPLLQEKINTIVNTQDKETVVSKFQQEVFYAIRKLEDTHARFNCTQFNIEKDIVLRRFKD
jgi:hypothetical protein